jgi:primosomal replication protein N
MEESKRNNSVFLRGSVSEPPRFSHVSREESFFQFSLEVCRLSGTPDTLHILARSALLESLELRGGDQLCVAGELRSFNNKSGVGQKLVITVFARELWFEDGADENTVALSGILCKAPNYRTTPMGREICDLMLAVNRRYGRSDYLPCIAWGVHARAAAQWTVGTAVRLTGRIQSRCYTKMIDGEPVEKTAYEVSVSDICAEPED